MERFLANIFYRVFNLFFKFSLCMRMRVWAWKNKHRKKDLLKLQKQVLNELKSYGVENLPTKFVVTLWGTVAQHCETTDTVFFPLAYLEPKFRYHGDSCIGYIRHEYGHACNWHYWQNEGVNGFNALFGNYHQPYEEWLFICWKKRRLDWKNYITKYAQVHPAEDFAECFFIYLQKRGKIDYLKHRPVVYKKIQYVEKVLKELSGIDFTVDSL